MTTSPSTEFGADDIVPIEKWGRDHWSMLLYFRSVEVNYAGFKVKFDPRMRQNRRNFRIMPGATANGLPMLPEHGSRLNDGTFIPKHDDWCCVQDFAVAGLLTQGVAGVEPNRVLRLAEKGAALASSLETHKAAGGSFSDFKLPATGACPR